MVTGGNLESFLNGVTVGESAGQVVTSNGDVNTIVTAGLNIASTLPQVGTASTVGLYMANTALIPLNMVSAIQNIKNIADNGASVQNVRATASDMAAIASAVAARLALAPIPQAKAAALGLTALSILLKYGPVYGQKFGEWLGQNIPTPYNIQKYFNDLFNRAKNWVWPRDPIILDLDGDGLETVGLASNVYFDHDGDGVLTKTGWAGKNDALLVWDRNANGSIDTGAELFGDFTPMPNGTLAPNGFAALAALDSNGDDTYLFGRGDGQDTVIDGDTSAGNSDTLRFKEWVAPTDVKLIRSGEDLVLACKGRRWRDGEAANKAWRIAA